MGVRTAALVLVMSLPEEKSCRRRHRVGPGTWALHHHQIPAFYRSWERPACLPLDGQSETSNPAALVLVAASNGSLARKKQKRHRNVAFIDRNLDGAQTGHILIKLIFHPTCNPLHKSTPLRGARDECPLGKPSRLGKQTALALAGGRYE